MHSPIDHEQTLRETIIETLVPEDDAVVGYIPEDSGLQGIGFWILIAGTPAFFGRTFKAAIVTARQGDWIVPERDGELTTYQIQWFEERSIVREWKERETMREMDERRTRIAQNTQYTRGDLIPDLSFDPSQETGNPLVEPSMETLDPQQVGQKPHLQEYEILSVIDENGTHWPGLWVLDDDVELLTSCKLHAEPGGFALHMRSQMHVEEGINLKTRAILQCNADGDFLTLKVYDEEGSFPIASYVRDGAGEIALENLVLE